MSSTARLNCSDIASRFAVAVKLRWCHPAKFLSDPPPFCGQAGTVSGGKRAQIGTRKSALDTDEHHANFALGAARSLDHAREMTFRHVMRSQQPKAGR